MFLADSYLHTLNPFAVQFTETFGIRWYGLAYAVGFLIAWAMVRFVARRNWSPLPLQRVGDLMFTCIVGVLLGGRLGYALFYEQHLFYTFSNSLPYWDLLAINKGGMASHGGMMGVIIAIWWFGVKHSVGVLHILDVGSLAATPGLCLGRIANFINGELWGKSLPPAMQGNPPWWSIKYPQQITEQWTAIVQRPVGISQQAYQELIHTAATDFNIARGAGDLDAQVVAEAQHRLELVAQKLSAVVGTQDNLYQHVEQIAHNASAPLHDQVVHVIKPLLTAYYPSQIFQAMTDGPILLGLLVLVWLHPRKPGVVGSWFLIFYGILRMVTEIFRQPDLGVHLTFGILSRGQTLSLLMTLIGVACLYISSRRSVPRLGGLFAGEPKDLNA